MYASKRRGQKGTLQKTQTHMWVKTQLPCSVTCSWSMLKGKNRAKASEQRLAVTFDASCEACEPSPVTRSKGTRGVAHFCMGILSNRKKRLMVDHFRGSPVSMRSLPNKKTKDALTAHSWGRLLVSRETGRFLIPQIAESYRGSNFQ